MCVYFFQIGTVTIVPTKHLVVMPPTSKKLVGHIALGLSSYLFVGLSVSHDFFCA